MTVKTILAAFSAIAICIGAHAQSLPALLVPTDSRALAMGGVNFPADLNQGDAKAYFGKWAPKTADNTLIGADLRFKIGDKLALSAEGKYFMDKPYTIYGSEGSAKGTFKPYDLIIGLGAEFWFTPALSAGLKLRNVTSAIGEKNTGSSFCGDLFARYGGANWGVELAGRNIGTKISYGSDSYAIPSLVGVDGFYKPLEGLTVAGEADYLFSGAIMAGVGAEYGFKDIAFVRAGFHYGDPAKALPAFLSLGIGGKYAGFRLDGTFLLLSETLGNTFLVSLGYEF